MSAATATTRRAVLGLAGLFYVGVFAAFVLLERPGVGIAHFFYIPICLVALVTDEMIGGLTGALTSGLYAAAVVAAPRVPSAHVLTSATAIRCVTFTIVGSLIGFYASRNRRLVERLQDLAGRDFVTGLGNARLFDEELARRCAAGRPFALLLGDVDDLKRLNDVHGHAAGNAALKRVGEVLTQHAHASDVVARLSGDEFALVTSLPTDQVVAITSRVNRALSAEGLTVSFGSTSCPEDGETAAELFHKADDRLFAQKLVRQNRASVVALADAR